MYFLTGRYRHPLTFSEAMLEQARSSLERVRNFCRLLGRSPDAVAGNAEPLVSRQRDAFFDALRDDFNTPQALAVLFELVAEGNRRLEAGQPFPGALDALVEVLGVIGLENLLEAEEPTENEASRLAEERERARQDGDYERADALRSELAERGYEVRDTDDGPVLVRSTAR